MDVVIVSGPGHLIWKLVMCLVFFELYTKAENDLDRVTFGSNITTAWFAFRSSEMFATFYAVFSTIT